MGWGDYLKLERQRIVLESSWLVNKPGYLWNKIMQLGMLP